MGASDGFDVLQGHLLLCVTASNCTKCYNLLHTCESLAVSLLSSSFYGLRRRSLRFISDSRGEASLQGAAREVSGLLYYNFGLGAMLGFALELFVVKYTGYLAMFVTFAVTSAASLALLLLRFEEKTPWMATDISEYTALK